VRNHPNEPTPTPTISAAAAAGEPARRAVLAAEKMAAQDRIVSGFDAVAPSEVCSAASASSPRRLPRRRGGLGTRSRASSSPSSRGQRPQSARALHAAPRSEAEHLLPLRQAARMSMSAIVRDADIDSLDAALGELRSLRSSGCATAQPGWPNWSPASTCRSSTCAPKQITPSAATSCRCRRRQRSAAADRLRYR